MPPVVINEIEMALHPAMGYPGSDGRRTQAARHRARRERRDQRRQHVNLGRLLQMMQELPRYDFPIFYFPPAAVTGRNDDGGSACS